MMVEFNLKERYLNVVIEYVEAFMRKHELYDEDTGEYFKFEWVADEVGKILIVSDYFVPFDDIRVDIDDAIAKETYFKYYDYSLEMVSDGKSSVSYKNYIKGMR